MSNVNTFRSDYTKRIEANGVDQFDREAGPLDAPVLLLHSFPSSSHMYRPPDPAAGQSVPCDRAGAARLRVHR
jgi:pimeloyl-ACP methyl ester carboxylesterase